MDWLRAPGVLQALGTARWGEWDTWSACTCSCAGGTKRRNRVIVQVVEAPGGLDWWEIQAIESVEDWTSGDFHQLELEEIIETADAM